MTLYLVSCVAVKVAHPTRARDLYISAWFQKARRFIEATGEPWRILSAKYGLVNPDAIIAPYEQTLNTAGVVERKRWSAAVFDDLMKLLNAGDTVTFLAGARYREYLMPRLEVSGVRCEIPMLGLPIGLQLRWLDRHAP